MKINVCVSVFICLLDFFRYVCFVFVGLGCHRVTPSLALAFIMLFRSFVDLLAVFSSICSYGISTMNIIFVLFLFVKPVFVFI